MMCLRCEDCVVCLEPFTVTQADALNLGTTGWGLGLDMKMTVIGGISSRAQVVSGGHSETHGTTLKQSGVIKMPSLPTGLLNLHPSKVNSLILP